MLSARLNKLEWIIHSLRKTLFVGYGRWTSPMDDTVFQLADGYNNALRSSLIELAQELLWN